MTDFTDIITALILPPGGTFVLVATGLVLIGLRRRSGWYVAIFGALALWLTSTNFAGSRLLRAFEEAPASQDQLRDVEAIVTLGGNIVRHSPEFGEDVATGDSLARLRYASLLHRQTGAPVLVAGGRPEGARLAEADALAAALRTIYRIEPRWIEAESNTTAESAQRSYSLLRAEGITTIALVTASWHMPRAARAFRKAGFQVVCAATNYLSRPSEPSLLDFLPSASGLMHTGIAMREMLGLAWYALKGHI